MSTLEDLEDLEQAQKKEGGDAEMTDAPDGAPKDDIFDAEILSLSTPDISMRKRLMDNDLKIMKDEYRRLNHNKKEMNDKIKENLEKIENNR